jgi:hypothetical protein
MKKLSVPICLASIIILLAACTTNNPTSGNIGSVPTETGDTHLREVEIPTPSSSPEARQPTQPISDAVPREPRATDVPPPPRARLEFKTDFSLHSIPYSDIISGGPPKDGIPPLDEPKFINVEEAAEWLRPVEPVVFVQVGDEARAYPLQILTYHEIVNDTVGDLPLAVTFCPLCNTAIVFERSLDEKVLDFGTTGYLRYSNLLMYDRQTESWWQQANGEAVVGELLGAQLNFYPGAIISWEDFRSNYPVGKVLSRETGFSRPYGRNPYEGYDNINNPPFLYRGPASPGKLPPMARVLTVDLGSEATAYPYDVLEEIRVVNDSVGGVDLLVIWEPGTASALDSVSIAAGRDVGTASAFSRLVHGKTLTFRYEDGTIVDEQTGSAWNLLGQAVSGELSGTHLEPVVAINHFWFSWAAFKPETSIYQP